MYGKLALGVFVAIGYGDDKSAMRFVKVPRPFTEIATVSPGWRYTGGFRPMPTPAGVPVARTSPGINVCPSDTVLIK